MAIAPSKPSSLYELSLEVQEVDGQLALALDLANSDDPEQQEQAQTLINELLERASDNQAVLHRKANAICHVHESLLAKAAHLRQVAADRLEKAAAEERAAGRLLDYLTKCLSALNPGQKKFALPEFVVASRPSEAVETGPELPAEFKRFEIKIKLQAGLHEAADQALAEITELLRDRLEIDPSRYEIKVVPADDKSGLKPLLKAGQAIAGARLVKTDNWSIK